MRRVVVESPYSARKPETALREYQQFQNTTGADPDVAYRLWLQLDREENLVYARECVLDCLERGEAPVATHILYANVPRRSHGRAAAEARLAWHDIADAVVFYIDRGWAPDMMHSYEYATALGRVVEIRSLGTAPLVFPGQQRTV